MDSLLQRLDAMISRYPFPQDAADVVGVNAIPQVVAHLCPRPFPLLVDVRVKPEIAVVYVGVLDVTLDIDGVEYVVVALVHAEPTCLMR